MVRETRIPPLAKRRIALIAAALGATALSAQGAGDDVRRAPSLGSESCSLPYRGVSRRPGAGAAMLVAGLGFAGLDADSRDPRARAWFAQGVRLIYAFDE